MSDRPEDLSAVKNSSPSLPAELFYPICSHVTSRRDLYKLAATSRILRRPAEAILHRKVVVDSRHLGRTFVRTLNECPRFAPLVRELELESNPLSRTPRDDHYWQDMRDAIGSLSALESLSIDDGRDQPLSWVLSKLPPNQLKVLRFAYIIDADAFRVLREQTALEELAWRGGLIALPPITLASTVHCDEMPQVEESRGAPFWGVPSPDPDDSVMSILHQCLPPSALPNLKYLVSESLGLARALVPGRPVTHLWIPGSMFTIDVSSSFIYPHITSSTEPSSSSGRFIQLAPRLELSSSQRSERLHRAIREFSLGKGPVLSLRMALDLERPDLDNVLSRISRDLPDLKCLGFVPGHFLDRPDGGSMSKLIDDQEPVTTLPPFKHLHTLCLWSIPTRKAVASLQNDPGLPALRTLACLHYSAAFEWLCLPIKDEDSDSSDAHKGGIGWCHEDEGNNKRRLVTPVHDPGNFLWKDV